MYLLRVMSHTAVQYSVETLHKSIQLDITETDEITDERSPFRIEQIQDDDKLMK